MPHSSPVAAIRPLPALSVPDPLELLSRLEWEHELAGDDPLLAGAGYSTRCDDPDPADDHDPLAHQLAWTDTAWTLDLQDVQSWQEIPHPADR